jgi:hypothetical protein
MPQARQISVTIRLVLQELLPSKRTRVVDGFARRIRASLHDPDEVRVELAEEVRFIADELRSATTSGRAHDAVPACAVSDRPRVRSVCGPAKNGAESGFALRRCSRRQNRLSSGGFCCFLRLPEDL